MPATAHRIPKLAHALVAVLLAAAGVAVSPGARPVHAAGTGAYNYWFPWYDIASPGMSVDNIHVVNPNASPATVVMSMPGQPDLTAVVGPGGEEYRHWSGAIGGPVHINGDLPVIVTQRVTYGLSFNEIPALPQASAGTSFWFPWYDKASAGVLNDNIHLVNTGPLDATVTVTMGFGAFPYTTHVLHNSATYFSFPSGVLGGAVHFVSDQPILVTQRVQWNQSFNELPGIPDSGAATWQMINWYDNMTAGYWGDDIHLLNPGAVDGTMTVKFPGRADTVVAVPHGSDQPISFPGGYGGALILQSTVPMIVTQRVNYYGSFKEYRALTQADATSSAWFNWYDNASPCFVQNNIHLYSPGHSVGTITLGVPALSQNFDLSGEGYFNFPIGTIGGPVHITVSSGDPVYPESRTVRCAPPPQPPHGTAVPMPVSFQMPGIPMGYCGISSAGVEAVGTDGHGNMGVPANSCDVAWFNAMPRPGDNGDAVFTGHVNWYDTTCAVFCDLTTYVHVGQDLYVGRADGSTVHFVVDGYNYYPATSPPDWLYVTTGDPQLSLITCAGEFTGTHYTERFVVHAHAV